MPPRTSLTPQQLFRQQQTMNQISSGVSGAASLLGQGVGMIQEAKNINTTAPTPMYDSFGKPMYNLGNFATQVSAIKPQGATGGEVLSGAMQGASAGAAFGPIGAGVGALVGAGSNLLFGRRRKKLQRRKADQANLALRNAQRSYNQSMTDYNQRQAAQSLYMDTQAEVDQRMNNVYQALS